MKLTRRLIAIGAAALIGLQLAACGETQQVNEDYITYSDGLDKNGYFIDIKASDYVTLVNYKGLEVEASKVQATEEDIQEQVDSVLSDLITYAPVTGRAVKDGDFINIDFVGKIDGVEFEGGSTYGYGTDVTIGLTNYIDGFLDQLIGHKPGETFDITVTFPKDYQNTEVAGKEAVFTITINQINGDEIIPELDAQIASDYGFDSVDAMLQSIRDWVVRQKKLALFSEVLLSCTVSEIPQAILDYTINYDLYQYQSYAIMMETTLEECLISFTGYESMDAYIEANLESYKETAHMYLAAQAIAEAEGIIVKNKEVDEKIYNVEAHGMPYGKQMVMIQEKLPDLIYDNVVIK